MGEMPLCENLRNMRGFFVFWERAAIFLSPPSWGSIAVTKVLFFEI
jgi:hypothetical protein